MFLFALSGFLGAASARAESRYSLFWSRQAYRAAAAVAVGITAARLLGGGGSPRVGFFDGMLFSIALLGILYFMFAFLFKLEAGASFFAGVSFVLGLVAVFKADGAPASGHPLAGGIAGHAFFMFLSLAAFSLSFIFSLLFLVQDHFLKRKRIERVFFLQLPPLELTSRLNFSFLTVGTASLLGGVLAGIFRSARLGGPPGFSVGPTLVLSVFTLLLYGAVLLIRLGPRERSRSAALVSIASYTLLLLTFLAAHGVAPGI